MEKVKNKEHVIVGGPSTSNKKSFNNLAIKKKQPYKENVPIKKNAGGSKLVWYAQKRNMHCGK